MPSNNNNHNSRRHSTDDDVDEDTQLAERLQEQYRQEFLERQARRNQRKNKSKKRYPEPSAPMEMESEEGFEIPYTRTVSTTTTEDSAVSDEELARRLQAQWNGPGPGTSSSSSYYSSSLPPSSSSPPVNDPDALLAQRLHQEEVQRHLQQLQAAQRQQQQQQSRFSHHVVPGVPVVAPTASSSRSSRRTPSSTNLSVPRQQSDFLDERAPETNDDFAASRIAQEMDDADMAQRLSLYEQESQRRRLEQGNAQRRRGNLFLYKLLPLFVGVAAIVVACLFIFDVIQPSDVGLDNIFGGGKNSTGNGWIDTDPFAGRPAPTGPAADASIAAWPNSGNGLSLTILNAMDETWTTFLNTAVANWDNGYPIDSLTLTIQDRNYEYECTAESGYLKVCNGDYGATQWRGLNEVMVNRRTNAIISSAARMNEFYLNKEGKAQKQYTVCHEIGHGFGLPHWDENFYNKDLGNCMDYTNNPQDNMTPDESNFEFLGELYGGRDTSTSTAAVALTTDTTEKKGTGNKKNQGTRALRQRSFGSVRVLETSSEHFQATIEDVSEDVVKVTHYYLAK